MLELQCPPLPGGELPCVGKVIPHGAATEDHGFSSTLPILYTEFTAATALSDVGVSLQYPQNHILESSQLVVLGDFRQ